MLATFTILAAPNAHPDLGKNGRYEWFLMLLAAVQSGPQVTMVSLRRGQGRVIAKNNPTRP